MPRWSRPLVAVLLLAFATLARAESLRLLAPAQGTTLRGGSTAELSWSAAQLPRASEEWEAFLSIDGGKYYAFRVTPHLDIALRRFTFLVPNVDAADARLLIRVGDERRETEYDLPGSFRIERDAHASVLLPTLLQSGHGEAAREGDPEVLAWADGARDGSGLTQQVATTVPPVTVERVAAGVTEQTAETAPGAKCADAPTAAAHQPQARAKFARTAERLAYSVDLLLVCRRRNI